MNHRREATMLFYQMDIELNKLPILMIITQPLIKKVLFAYMIINTETHNWPSIKK